jgi:hypothetical protein
MMEEEEEGGGRMAAATVYPNVYVFKRSLFASLVGVEELGPLRAMTATDAGLSLALNTTVTPPHCYAMHISCCRGSRRIKTQIKRGITFYVEVRQK